MIAIIKVQNFKNKNTKIKNSVFLCYNIVSYMEAL